MVATVFLFTGIWWAMTSPLMMQVSLDLGLVLDLARYVFWGTSSGIY